MLSISMPLGTNGAKPRTLSVTKAVRGMKFLYMGKFHRTSAWLATCRQAETGASSDGFVAIDAMVALAILASITVLSIAAAQTARRVAIATAEIRHATDQLQFLLDTSPRVIGTLVGQSGGFDWRIDTQAVAQSGASGAQMCNRIAQLRSAFSGRSYRFSTAEVCPTP